MTEDRDSFPYVAASQPKCPITSLRTCFRNRSQELEITLTGLVLPKANQKDLVELPDEARADMEFLFAEHIDDVLQATIPNLAACLVVG